MGLLQNSSSSSSTVNGADESSPLLGNQGEDNGKATSAPTLPSSAAQPGRPWQRRKRTMSRASIASSLAALPKVHDPHRIVAIMCVLIFFGSSSGGFTGITMTRILEDRFCREYYYGATQSLGGGGGGGDDDASFQPIDEDLCKVDVIQSRLAYLVAVHSFIEAAVGCVVAMPWGFVADRVGRRPVWALALFGMILMSLWQMAVVYFSSALPIRLYWLAPLGLIVGGGNAVLNAAVCGMLVDVLPEADRAISIMRIHVASMFGNLVSPALASILMPHTGPWPLVWFSLVLISIPIVGILFVPETLSTKPDVGTDTPATAETEEQDADATFSARLSRSLAELKDSLPMLQTPSVVFLLLTAAVTVMPVFYSTASFMAQFVSKRYHIHLAYTGYVQAAYGAAHVLVILVAIPWLSEWSLRPTAPRWLRMADERRRDLAFMRWSFAPLIAGPVIMALSTSLPAFVCGLLVMSLGSGAGSYVTSALTFYVGPEERTRAFSLMGVMQIVGSLYAMPMLAGLFAAGMKAGGLGIGLPYLGVAALCSLGVVLLAFVRLSETKDREEAADGPQSEDGTI
ncbi:hypothetical protein PFICI_10404 [Pestalotiopsis fici W106-1]|uniref:Major facilitator superfamily (MFS) profile domain-containing protein n=1 Tax=Pestalotiopsis fici (strain W106-1 / CGMCC3.15140) TaxID=1229662 RepID=W3WZ06_PESFW|nr:uncharacterized protein PFICI_10404 [Pestalotiopsis fici W106-1]ETS78342.1 hypothetical protein PFICI_10404 [Pestalotiopsis fici W106-1]